MEPRPQDALLTRDRPVEPGKTALIVVDVQNRILREQEQDPNPYFSGRLNDVVLPNLRRLIGAARAAGVEVMYTVIESLTKDGRDRSLDYKLSKIFVPKGSRDAGVIDAIAPGEDEIVLPKTSSSLFNSTNFDYLLRNLGVKHLIVTGLLTDQCVDQTVRDGADRGYRVVCVSDGCATYTEQRHEWALRLFAGYCRTVTTDALIEELRTTSAGRAES